jgi:L-cystine uptake protein TcyP (sodium:dicarboxylate symporter family)
MAMMAFPYIIVFWSIIRSFSKYKPLLMTKVLVILYLFVHIPILIFAMDRLDYFGSGSTIGAVSFVALGIILLTLTIAAVLGLFVFCSQIFSINK